MLLLTEMRCSGPLFVAFSPDLPCVVGLQQAACCSKTVAALVGRKQGQKPPF